jgi:16S rRNA (guanine527-N7)-methyltransferase
VPPETAPAPGESALESLCAVLGLRSSIEQRRALLDYLGLLQRWNGTYNLTAVRDPVAMFSQHLADCLAVMPPVLRHADGRSSLRVLDVGSGGGLPGVLIAILCPGFDVSCVDAVGKKMAFVRQVAGELRLANLHAHHSRIEALKTLPYDLITSRAFASLAEFVELTRRLLAPRGVWMAMKGRVPDDEISALPSDVEVFHVEPLQVPGLDAQRCLVWMRPRA